MNVRSIKTIDDRILLDDMAVKSRVEREIKREFHLTQLDLEILLCIGTCSASHDSPLLSVPDLIFFTGYSESNSARIYKRVERLYCDEKPFLEKINCSPARYGVSAQGVKAIRRCLELAKIFKDDLRVWGAS